MQKINEKVEYGWLQISDLHIFDNTEWKVMEDAYIRTVPVSARQRNLDFYIPSGFEAKIYDDVLTEDSNTIYVVYVGYYSAGELLSISVWSTNRDEGEQALNVLNTIRK